MRRWTAGVLAATALAATVLSTAGCSTQTAANDFGAPINAIPATDVVVETNIQAAAQAAQTQLESGGSFSGFGAASSGGVVLTTGASSTPSQISYAVVSNGSGVVFAGYNGADNHCIGQVYVSSTLSAPVLGTANAGQYDFIAPSPSSSDCDAASLAAQVGAPSGWPVEPSSGGWSASTT